MAEAKGFLAAHDHLNAPDEVDQEAGPGTQTRCRVCFRSDGRDLISPCKCEGSSKFVHRECLDYHRTVKARKFCICQLYRLQSSLLPKGTCSSRKKRTNSEIPQVSEYTMCICCDSNCNLFIGKRLVFGNKKELVGYIPNRFSHTHFFVLLRFTMITITFSIFCRWSISTKAFYYGFMAEADQTWLELMFIMELVVIGLVSFIGLLYAIAIASIFGRQIWKYHYYTFGKRLLTREYIVDDMDGLAKDWRPPPLPPDHVDELEELGFL
ncbi:hypothetical protein ZIOFF_063563 [Zingiber officinale]|uniref:RING-CH-type domain-containing protein n=1 Tax=Zingiber officinale TaxID=94328 RepID=A0A8J5K9T4_ZINOF|nr:hypothetical protein ZIOFF_063563 [Zingiber officinale]